ncbi:ATP synthase subunit s, mitochondrial-like [Antedon mediterranea]|uniref:ATP synthase subunit s, mitochondrial-like n=1 Tax=Antedon mediterranea TaxID=105859 RepID=UPI003AF6DC60
MFHTTKSILWNSLNGHQQCCKRGIGNFLRELAKKQKQSKTLAITHNLPKYFKNLRYDIAAGDYIVVVGGAVRYTNDEWFGRKKTWVINQLPSRSNLPETTFVDAIDFNETGIEKHGLKHIEKLHHLKYLSFADCPFVDDNCIASLVNFCDTLTHLNINRCPLVTSNGISLLYKLRNLERVNMDGLNHIQNLLFIAMMLEDIRPNLRLGIVTEQLKELRNTMEHAKKHGLLLEDEKKPEEPINGLILNDLKKDSTTDFTTNIDR